MFKRAPPQFRGAVHGARETWATALRRLGGNETRSALNRRLGAKRQLLRQRASSALGLGRDGSWEGPPPRLASAGCEWPADTPPARRPL